VRTQSDRGADLAVGRLIEAYDQYIELLATSEAALLGLAYAHGFHVPESKVKLGEQMRARIAELKTTVLNKS
jgi:hypothetical protein